MSEFVTEELLTFKSDPFTLNQELLQNLDNQANEVVKQFSDESQGKCKGLKSKVAVDPKPNP